MSQPADEVVEGFRESRRPAVHKGSDRSLGAIAPTVAPPGTTAPPHSLPSVVRLDFSQSDEFRTRVGSIVNRKSAHAVPDQSGKASAPLRPSLSFHKLLFMLFF